MLFPQYRKYKNNKSYFEILGKDEFIEYQLQFNKIHKHHFKASILPDRNLIQDMLFNFGMSWEKIDRADLDHFLKMYS